MGYRADRISYDDETLIRHIAQAQVEAFGQLYDRYSRLVFSVAFAIVGDRATAEEITLDVFTRVWQRAGQYRADRAKVSTWLTHITRHHAIDVLRRRAARPEQYSVSWEEMPPGAQVSANSPDEAIEITMQRERVRAAIAQLPQDQKTALALAYFKGYTHSQIAKALELPLGTVKTRIRSAVQKLRRLLQDDLEPPDTSENAPIPYSISEE